MMPLGLPDCLSVCADMMRTESFRQSLIYTDIEYIKMFQTDFHVHCRDFFKKKHFTNQIHH